MKRIYLLAGERSGDVHGAGLIAALRELRPDLQLAGAGGPRMREAAGGCAGEFQDWVEQAGVTGLWEVLKRYRWFRQRFDEHLDRIDQWRPDLVVLIDYPGFNLRLARQLRRRHPDLILVYYIAPQVWAWKKGRVHGMARDLDRMICIFPFEQPLFEQAGLATVFSGHPLVDALRATGSMRAPDPPGTAAGAGSPAAGSAPAGAPAQGRQSDLVGLFPGSRSNEIERLGPVLVAAAVRLAAAKPGLRFAFSAASEPLAERLRGWLEREPSLRGHWRVEVGREAAHELMRRAGAGAVASGTATLEAAALGLPHVLVYRVNWFTYLLARLVVRIRHLGIVNVIAGRTVVTELIQHRCRGGEVAERIGRLLDDEGLRGRWLAEIGGVLDRLAGDPREPAYRTAARAVLGEPALFRAGAPGPGRTASTENRME